jgi:hypothetical protein
MKAGRAEMEVAATAHTILHKNPPPPRDGPAGCRTGTEAWCMGNSCCLAAPQRFRERVQSRNLGLKESTCLLVRRRGSRILAQCTRASYSYSFEDVAIRRPNSYLTQEVMRVLSAGTFCQYYHCTGGTHMHGATRKGKPMAKKLNFRQIHVRRTCRKLNWSMAAEFGPMARFKLMMPRKRTKVWLFLSSHLPKCFSVITRQVPSNQHQQ